MWTSSQQETLRLRLLSERYVNAMSRLHPAGDRRAPFVPEEMCGVGLFLPFDQAVYDVACATPLPPPTVDEGLYHAEAPEEYEERQDTFCQASTEDELGAADVLTQA